METESIVNENIRLRAENKELKDWKEATMSVWPPIQEIGQALGLQIGESVHDKILPGILKSQSDAKWLWDERERWMQQTNGLIIERDATIARAEAAEIELSELKAQVAKDEQTFATNLSQSIRDNDALLKRVAKLEKFVEDTTHHQIMDTRNATGESLRKRARALLATATGTEATS